MKMIIYHARLAVFRLKIRFLKMVRNQFLSSNLMVLDHAGHPGTFPDQSGIDSGKSIFFMKIDQKLMCMCAGTMVAVLSQQNGEEIRIPHHQISVVQPPFDCGTPFLDE